MTDIIFYYNYIWLRILYPKGLVFTFEEMKFLTYLILENFKFHSIDGYLISIFFYNTHIEFIFYLPKMINQVSNI